MSLPKIGVLGGGQLGRMLAEAGSPLDLDLHFMDRDQSYPVAQVTPNFVQGNFTDYDDVMKFGQDKDIITVEIEAVSVDALESLHQSGKAVYPQPDVLRVIRDKGKQKTFYSDHNLPTSAFKLAEGKEAIIDMITAGKLVLPFVQKARRGGYDGKGVVVIREEADLTQLLPGPSVIEELVDIDKELAVIVASNGSEIMTYPAVEMLFHPTANLVEFLACPASINAEVETSAAKLARKVASALGIRGLLAVELFLTKSGEILINEVAPRPHNSGHHTIEACESSQFEQHLRCVIGLPLGSTKLLRPAVMINLLGEPNHQGLARYEGLPEVLAIEGVHIHLYGKKETRPYRKMGHATVLAENLEKAKDVAREVLQTLRITAY